MAWDAHDNFGKGTLTNAPGTSGTSFILGTGEGANFSVNQPVTIAPPNVQPDASNAEIGYVTAVSTDTLTVTRAQQGTSAIDAAIGDMVYGTITTKALTDIEAAIDTKITGPASSTDNNIPRFDSTTGKLLQTSTEAVITDTGRVLLGPTEAEDSAPAARLKISDNTGSLSDIGFTAYGGGFGTIHLSGAGGTAAAPSDTTATTDVGAIWFQKRASGTFSQVATITGTQDGNLKLASTGSGTVQANSVPVVTTTGTQTLTNKTLTTPTIAQINNSTAPGVKLQIRTQTDNNNSVSSDTTAGVFMQTGWGQVAGSGAATLSESVTFPTSFTTVYSVVVSLLSVKSSSTPATSIVDMTVPYNTTGFTISASSVGGSGFTINLQRATGTFGTGAYYGYSWIAWGV